MSMQMFAIFALGLFAGSGAVWSRAGSILFSRFLFPVLLVFGLATAATFVDVPGIKFDLSEHLPSLRGQGEELAKAFGVGFLAALALRFIWRQVLIAGGQAGKRSTRRWQSARKLYYETAIRMGVLTAATDGRAEPREFEALEDVFDLSIFNVPNARGLYRAQIEQPVPMSGILRPFLKKFDPGCSACETLVLGMASVAIADDQAGAGELGLIRMTASKLGLTPADTTRILASAGIGEAAENHRASRAQHLATLGLPSDATDKQAHKAWKRLSARYAPARLILLAVPEAEKARIDQLRAEIDTAFTMLDTGHKRPLQNPATSAS